MQKSVVVPQSQIDKIEQARKDLWALYAELYPKGNTMMACKFLDITQPMWVLSNKKYIPAYDLTG